MPKGKKTSNPWMTHLAQFRKSHPNMSLGDAMQAAKKTYKRPARQAGAGFFDKLREKNPERFDMMKDALKKSIFGGRKMAGGEQKGGFDPFLLYRGAKKVLGGGKFSSMPVKPTGPAPALQKYVPGTNFGY